MKRTKGYENPHNRIFLAYALAHECQFSTVKVLFQSDAGVQTYSGKEGIESITISLPFDEEVSFHFQSFRNSHGNEDVCRFEGQLPEIHFFVQWPEGTH